jgi:hypothetical protein
LKTAALVVMMLLTVFGPRPAAQFVTHALDRGYVDPVEPDGVERRQVSNMNPPSLHRGGMVTVFAL